MSMPAKAKFPVIAWNCHPPPMNKSRAMASLSHGSRPTTNGAAASTAFCMPTVSQFMQASPQPTSPLSAVSLTMTSDTPSRAISALTSLRVYLMESGKASSLVIFMGIPLSGSVQELVQEGGRAFVGRLFQDLGRRPGFDDVAVGHEDDAVGDVARELD